MKGRAETSEEKRVVIERLLAAWLKQPAQRLGQLIENATGAAADRKVVDLFYIEDQSLVECVEKYLEEAGLQSSGNGSG